MHAYYVIMSLYHTKYSMCPNELYNEFNFWSISSEIQNSTILKKSNGTRELENNSLFL